MYTSALQGHTNTIEDLVWQPGSAAELASVGDDYKLLFWDTRTGTSPSLTKEQAHGEHDLHCVDWSSLQLELLVTGTPLHSASRTSYPSALPLFSLPACICRGALVRKEMQAGYASPAVSCIDSCSIYSSYMRQILLQGRRMGP